MQPHPSPPGSLPASATRGRSGGVIRRRVLLHVVACNGLEDSQTTSRSTSKHSKRSSAAARPLKSQTCRPLAPEGFCPVPSPKEAQLRILASPPPKRYIQSRTALYEKIGGMSLQYLHLWCSPPLGTSPTVAFSAVCGPTQGRSRPPCHLHRSLSPPLRLHRTFALPCIELRNWSCDCNWCGSIEVGRVDGRVQAARCCSGPPE